MFELNQKALQEILGRYSTEFVNGIKKSGGNEGITWATWMAHFHASRAGWAKYNYDQEKSKEAWKDYTDFIIEAGYQDDDPHGEQSIRAMEITKKKMIEKWGKRIANFEEIRFRLPEEDVEVSYDLDEELQTQISSGFKFLHLTQLLRAVDGGPTEYLQEKLPNIMPFVFHQRLTAHHISLGEFDGEDDIELDLPFKMCHFELADRVLYSIIPPDSSGSEVYNTYHVLGVIAIEDSPKEVSLYAHFIKIKGDGKMEENIMDVSHLNDIRAILSDVLKIVGRGSLGISKPKTMIKYKDSSGKKQQFKLKTVYHIGGKAKPDNFDNRGISWDLSHRIDVRGHWRKLSGDKAVGKDRAGERSVPGFTWVLPHQRGPEDAPYVKKVRHIHADERRNNV
jgi:hypothetical protein